MRPACAAAAAASAHTFTRAPPLSAQQQQQHYQHRSYQSLQSPARRRPGVSGAPSRVCASALPFGCSAAVRTASAKRQWCARSGAAGCATMVTRTPRVSASLPRSSRRPAATKGRCSALRRAAAAAAAAAASALVRSALADSAISFYFSLRATLATLVSLPSYLPTLCRARNGVTLWEGRRGESKCSTLRCRLSRAPACASVALRTCRPTRSPCPPRRRALFQYLLRI